MLNPVKTGQPEHYLFVIDTDTYAGGFEREMCAYLTGQVGECEVGQEDAELAKQEIPEVVAQLEKIIEQVPDEFGCYRPVSIFPNPRYGNNGNGRHAVLTERNRNNFQWPAYNSVAIYFHSIPDPRLATVMKERARNFAAKERVAIEGFRFLEQRTIYKELEL